MQMGGRNAAESHAARTPQHTTDSSSYIKERGLSSSDQRESANRIKMKSTWHALQHLWGGEGDSNVKQNEQIDVSMHKVHQHLLF